jgi:hypothetical protein
MWMLGLDHCRKRGARHTPAEKGRPLRGAQYARTGGFCEMRAPVQFVVLKRADKWVVKWQDAERAFPGQHKAVEAAIKLAHDSGKNGKPAVVLFQRTKTNFRKIWTYGESAYPPTKSDLGVLQPRKPKMPAASASHDAPSAVASDHLEPAGNHGDEA